MGLSEDPIWKIVQPGQRGSVSVQAIEKIDPDTSKAIIAENHCPNRDTHGISTLVNCLPILF